jgi:predicted SAM-dependent methyltransferase
LDGICKITTEADLATYSYVQIAHVLEHVPEPLALLKRVSSFVKPSGYLYIEVPQDLSDAEFTELKSGSTPRGLPVHEHINFFYISAIACLVKAAGINLVSIKSEHLNLGWITSTIIRALCQPSNK